MGFERKWSKPMSAAIVLWSAAVGFTCVRSFVQPQTRTTYPIWSSVGADWRSGNNLYDTPESVAANGWRCFRYSPTIASLMVLCNLPPLGLGGALWRLAGAAAFLIAFRAWLRQFAPTASDAQQGVYYLLALPLALDTLNNGQANLFVAALMPAAVVAAARQRWTAAACAVALAAAFKVYPLALGLILAVVYPRRFAWRLLLASAVVAAVPFLLQRPAYVVAQYWQWLELIGRADVSRRMSTGDPYRDMWLLAQVCGLRPSPSALSIFTLLQAATGAACALWCLAARRRGRPDELILRDAWLLTSCWIMLFGPATESSTFVLFAPTLAWCLMQTRDGGPAWARNLTVVGAGLLALCVLAGIAPGGVARFHNAALHPLGTLLVTIAYVITTTQSMLRREDERSRDAMFALPPCSELSARAA